MLGRAGELPIIGLDHETTTMPLVLTVYGRTPSGAAGGYEQMEHNLEALTALLGVKHRLMTLTFIAGTVVRQADVILDGISEPEINTDAATGGTVSRSSGLLAGERLLIDRGTMRSAKLNTDSWDLAAGTNVTGQVAATGPGSAFRWLHLTPSIGDGDPFSRVVLVTSTATSTTAASKLEIRARRSHL